MIKIKLKFSLLFFFPILIGIFFVKIDFVKASDLENCVKLPEIKQEKCISEIYKKTQTALQKLEEKKANFQSKIQQDVQSLKNQIGYLNAETEKTNLQISFSEQQIGLSRLNIAKTKKEIQQTNEDITKAKEKLAESIREFYEYDKKNVFAMAFVQSNISKIFDEVVYAENLQQEINKNISELKDKKEIFKKNNIALEENIKNLKNQIESYNRQIEEMAELKEQKLNLLEITKGDEQKYKEILENIRSEKREIILLASKAIIATVDESSSWWYYSQRSYSDTIPNCYYCAKWSSKNCLNIKRCTIASHGCAITSVAMLYTRYGKAKLPPVVLKESSFDGNGNIFWPSRLYNSGHGLSWSKIKTTIDKKIKNGDPVIIFIRVSGSAGHYVVVYGKMGDKYLVNDPYFGQGIYLDDSLKKLGSSAKNIDQMLYFK